MQVEAFMKKLPTILPRSSIPDKTQLSVRSSPPSLAPKDASGVGGASGTGGPAAAAAASGGGVKVIAMATLPQQQGGPLPVMILPQGCLSYDRDTVAPPPPPQAPPSSQQQHAVAAAVAPTSVVQKARGNVNKRPLEAVTSACGSTANAPLVKRKRGRPRKPRPEDTPPLPPPLPQPQLPALSPHTPIITSVTGSVIQKASSSSSSSSSSQQVLELVIQDQPGPGLVLSQLPSVAAAAEHRGVMVQCCQPGGALEAEHHGRPLLVFQSSGAPGWELAASGRTPMVEVIQKAPRPPSNSTGTISVAQLHPPLPPPPPASVLPLPTMHQERGEVEITLTPVPVEVHVHPTPPHSSSSSSSAFSSSSSAPTISVVVKTEEEEVGSGDREEH